MLKATTDTSENETVSSENTEDEFAIPGGGNFSEHGIKIFPSFINCPRSTVAIFKFLDPRQSSMAISVQFGYSTDGQITYER